MAMTVAMAVTMGVAMAPSAFFPVVGDAVAVFVIKIGTVPGIGTILGEIADAVAVFIRVTNLFCAG